VPRPVGFIACLLAALASAGSGLAIAPARGQSLIDEWASVKVPPPPPLKEVTLDPKTTALLMLDVMNQNCGKRPRCLATIPAMKRLLTEARAKGVAVIYTFFGTTTAADVIKDVAPAAGEPSVTSFADKFLNTDLDKKLKDRGIQTVIVVGTAANGAVLYTGSGAALRGLKVIVPVDGISAVDPYPEQFAVWQLANGPTLGQNVTVTKIDMIRF
jgi:nicotinamidase-related amidase